MALPRLPNVYFSHACPNCGHVRSETGLWFRSVGSYKCKACSGQVRMSYEEKARLLGANDKYGSDPHPAAPGGAVLKQQPPVRR
jgi:hypothetical protein